MKQETTTLWRPVGPQELRLIEDSGMKRFPPRLPEQPIFYPVTSEAYAVKIARDWNVPASGSGYVTRFEVRSDFLSAYDVQDAGGIAHREYWIPAEELDEFNAAIVGAIEVVQTFPQRQLWVQNWRSGSGRNGWKADCQALGSDAFERSGRHGSTHSHAGDRLPRLHRRLIGNWPS